METYTYNDLYNIIKTQTEKEKKSMDKKKEPSTMDNFLSKGLRTINNPTLQNFNNTIGILINSKQQEIKEDDKSKYIYKS
jgi:hypothetical protein